MILDIVQGLATLVFGRRGRRFCRSNGHVRTIMSTPPACINCGDRIYDAV